MTGIRKVMKGKTGNVPGNFHASLLPGWHRPDSCRHLTIPIPPAPHFTYVVQKRGHGVSPGGHRSLMAEPFSLPMMTLRRAFDPFQVREAPEEVSHGASAKCVCTFKETQNEMALFLPLATVTSGGEARSYGCHCLTAGKLL